MQPENWRPAVGYEGRYEVSDLGNVRNASGHVLAQHLDTKGYWQVGLFDGRKVSRSVHRLVCRAFHGEPSPGLEVAHLDGNRKNAAASNLMWATPKENAQHKVEHGTYYFPPPKETMRRGESHPHAKLTNEQVSEMRRRKAAGESVRALASEFGINRTHAYRVINGEHWGEAATAGADEDGIAKTQEHPNDHTG